MLTTVVCSACGITYDPHNHKDIGSHDRECPRGVRKLTLEDKLKATKRKANQLENSLARISSSAKRFNLPILSSRKVYGMIGTHTPSMLCGKTSQELEQSSSVILSRKCSVAKPRARFDVSNKSGRNNEEEEHDPNFVDGTSACGINYDPYNHEDIGDHDKECPLGSRKLCLEVKLKTNKRKANQYEESLARNTSSAKRLHLPIIASRTDSSFIRAYTPSMLCGKTSEKLMESSSDLLVRRCSKAKTRARFDVSNKSSRSSIAQLPSYLASTQQISTEEQGHFYSSTFLPSKKDESLSNCEDDIASYDSESDSEVLSISNGDINDQNVSHELEDDDSIIGNVERKQDPKLC